MTNDTDRRGPALIIHGGCGTYDLNEPLEYEHQQQQRTALGRIIAEGWHLLTQGMAAIDAAEKVANLLEDDPAFNAGIGAAIGSEMQIELDASIMDGRDLRCGAVAGLLCIPRAASVARRVMDHTGHVFLCAQGADAFAAAQGFHKIPAEQFYTPYQLHWWRKIKAWREAARAQAKGTIGVVAMDQDGNVAAATSTGGMSCKMPGRVGDSSIIGAGTYAENGVGGASATGYGEQIIKVALTKTALDMIRYQGCSAQAACEHAIRTLSKLKDGLAGIILIDNTAEIGAWCNETYLPRAFMSARMREPVVAFEMTGC